ncbi:DEAD/DEAH box helicase [Granulosicoccus sp. 3-233]|uniref:DEAD/DEAH box helicase n=1 Tax=Granulosicoccus sp. 3-233 TaxID=3417969 RepID=UPI003D352F61
MIKSIMLELGITDIRSLFTKRTFVRAQGILARDDVLLVEWIDDLDTLMGVVEGTAPEPYVTRISREGRRLVCRCDCPVGRDCKHAAATLLQTLANEISVADLAPTAVVEAPIDVWMKRLNGFQTRQDKQRHGTGGGSNECMLYSLEPLSDVAGCWQGAEVKVYSSRLLQNGKLGKGRLYRISSYSHFHGFGSRPEDDMLIDLVRTMAVHSGNKSSLEVSPPYVLSGHLGASVVQLLLRSERLYPGDRRDVPLEQGVARELQSEWLPTDDESSLRLHLFLDDVENWYPIFTDPPYYVDMDRNSVGSLQVGIDSQLLPFMFDMPAVPQDSAVKLANEMSVMLPDGAMTLPAEPSIHLLQEPLVAEVVIRSVNQSPSIDHWVVACVMRYGEHRFAVDLRRSELHASVIDEDGNEVLVERDHEAEYQYHQRFQEMLPDFEPCLARDPSLYHVAEYQPVRRDPDGRLEAFERLFSVKELIESRGFTLIIEPPVGVDVRQVRQLSASLKADSTGWFEVGLMLEHDGVRYELMPLIIDWLQRTGGDTPLRFQAEDGSWLEASEQMLAPIVETMSELLDEQQPDTKLIISRARALSLARLRDELEETGVDTHWHDSEQLLQLADTLRQFASQAESAMTSARQPAGMLGELREYQLIGMGWLNFLAQAGLNGILADDMGLGKTAQTLAHLQSLKNQTARKHRKNRNGPFLVVAPTSLLSNWEREARQFTPGLSTRIWHGSDRHDRPLVDNAVDIVITSYALALRDHELLSSHGFRTLVLDEAQTIKNPNAKITQALKTMPIAHRLCLTGTPLENHLGELWSLFDFLMPGMLDSQKRFSQHFRTPIERQGNQRRQARLNAVVQPFMLRRRKEQVARELPEKTEVVRTIVLGDKQARLYESIRLAMQARVKKLLEQRGLARSHIEMLDALLKLRQTCCHPQLVKVPAARKVTESAKTEFVLEMIEELVAEGRKILLFSQFTEMLGLLEAELRKAGIPHVKLTGRTRKRDVVIDAFQEGEVPLFLISLKAGGTGLNLTAADTVIHYDPWWNPAVERQATDRAHRIGQDKPVFVYKLVARDTLEEKIVAMQERKQALADATVEKRDGEAFSAFSADDMLTLFEGD